MFLRLDTYLITKMQWIVRQCELFTPYSRTMLGEFLLKLFKYTCIFWVMAVPFMAAVRVITLFFFLSATTSMVPLYMILKKTFHEQSKRVSGMLPQEITTRYLARMLAIITSAFITAIYAWILLLPGVAHPLLLLSIGLHIFVIIIITCFEYFLCTTSLPPGEKEKHKVKQEMKHAVPVVG